MGVNKGPGVLSKIRYLLWYTSSFRF